MKLKILFITFLLINFLYSYGQQLETDTQDRLLKEIQSKLIELDSKIHSLTESVNENKNQNLEVQNNIRAINRQALTIFANLDSIQKKMKVNDEDFGQFKDQVFDQKNELTNQINANSENTALKFSDFDRSLSRNTLYWVIAVLVIGIFSLGTFLILKNNLKSDKTKIFESISKTRKDLENEAIRLDEKLVSVMESQLQLMSKESSTESDHSLALKVADEIVRIEKNIRQMDKDTRGLKQLTKAVERIKDNFAANGYEMVELMGKSYFDGIKADVLFKSDPTLKKNEQIITRIIKPQINYKGVMIQQAQIEVSQAE